LLFYITERIVEVGGGVPEDFRADPNVAWPETADLPAMFTVGQEFLVADAYRWFGGGMPLHRFCVIFFSIVASCAAFGLFGLAYELTGRVSLALLAALAFLSIPLAYRTVGFVLIREDLALPVFALHLWLAARAARVGSLAAWGAAGLALAAALSSWHAMGFVVDLELAACVLWLLRHGESPFVLPRAWAVFATLVLAALVVPVLAAKSFLLSPTMQLVGALLITGLVSRRRPGLSPLQRIPIFFAAFLTLGLLAFGVSHLMGRADVYGHVFQFLSAKLRYLGQRPLDPNELSFDVRLLWQGPFGTADLPDVTLGLTLAVVCFLVALPRAALGWLRRERDPGFLVLAAFAALAFVAGYLVRRTLVLPAMLVPVLAVVWLDRVRAGRAGSIALLVLSLGQLAFTI
jgi:hypothetical protein